MVLWSKASGKSLRVRDGTVEGHGQTGKLGLYPLLQFCVLISSYPVEQGQSCDGLDWSYDRSIVLHGNLILRLV